MKTNTYLAEVTDTFGGEANYCWVRRYRINASSELGAIRKLHNLEGYAWRKEYEGRYKAQGAHIVAFIEYDEGYAGETYPEAV
jgi:hypothetical protein